MIFSCKMVRLIVFYYLCEVILNQYNMFKAIVRFSIRKKLFVALTTLFLLIGGIWSMLTLPVDAVPDITNNQVQIVTVSPTLAPQEV